jgi:23S rRNA pseudouridine2605 synthase
VRAINKAPGNYRGLFSYLCRSPTVVKQQTLQMKKKSTQFDKFAKKKSNAAIKEQFKQEKRKLKKEREEYFDKKREEVKQQKAEGKRYEGQDTRHKAQGTRYKTEDPKQKVQGANTQDTNQRKPATVIASGAKQNQQPISDIQQPGSRNQKPGTVIASGAKQNQKPATSVQQPEAVMPLNKFLAHSGVSGRREAAEIVKQGKVKVNNVLITEPGHKVSAKDDIRVNGKKIFVSKNLVYILLNKPKDYITTTDDPQGRKTVLDIIGKATPERIYPVGRLDRNTSGVLLLTNDGELSQKLTHPSNNIKKVYAVTLNRPLEKKDFDKILKGVMLEDGMASVDALAYADITDKTILGIEIHSGRNRIVRRIFEALGYDCWPYQKKYRKRKMAVSF